MNPYANAIVYNTFEGGVSGTTITTANSGGASGTAFNSVQISGTASAQFTTVSPLKNNMSLRVIGNSSGYANVRWFSSSIGTLTNSCGAVHASFDSFGGVTTFLQAYADDTDANPVFRIKTTPTGALRLSNGANTATIADTTGTMNAGQVYRIEWQIDHGAGAYVIEFFDPDGTTALGRATGTAAGLGAQTVQVRLGVSTLSTWSATFDNFAVGVVKLGPVAPPPATPTNPYASAIAYNTAEGGSDGTTVTSGNSGGLSGVAFTAVQRTGTTTLAFTGDAIHDTMSYRFVGDGSGYANVRWNSTVVGSLTQSCGAVYARFDDFSSTITFLIALSDDNETYAYRLKVTSSGALQLSNSGNNTVATSAAVMDAGQIYRIEWQIDHSTGAYAAAFYDGDMVTAAGYINGTSIGAFGAQVQQVRLGVLTTGIWSGTFDSFAINSSQLGTRTDIALPPVVSAGADIMRSSYENIVLTATVSDPNGDEVTVMWGQVGGSPTVPLVDLGEGSVQFMSPAVRAGTVLQFMATASDGALTADDIISVTIAPHNEWAIVSGSEYPIRSYDI